MPRYQACPYMQQPMSYPYFRGEDENFVSEEPDRNGSHHHGSQHHGSHHYGYDGFYPYMEQNPCMMYPQQPMCCPDMMYQQPMQQPMGYPGMMYQQQWQQPMMGQMYQSMGYRTERDDEDEDVFADGGYRYVRPYFPHHGYHPYMHYMYHHHDHHHYFHPHYMHHRY
jgi:hypothetical protein